MLPKLRALATRYYGLVVCPVARDAEILREEKCDDSSCLRGDKDQGGIWEEVK